MKWRYIFVLLALGAFIVIGFLNRGEVKEAIGLLRTARWPLLALAPLIQLISFYANARYYQTFMATFSYPAGLGRLYRMSLALNFVNQITPSAGISGVTFFSYGLRQQVPAGKATLIQFGRYFLTFVSYSVLLLFALLLIYFGGGIDKIIVRVVVLLIAGSLLGFGLFIYALSTKRGFNRLIYRLQRLVDWSAARFRRSKRPVVGKGRMKRLLIEFHQGFDLVSRERHRLLKPLFYALMGSFMELATLYVVFAALGALINPGAAIIGYAVANTASAVSVVPGDVGIYELAMVASLSATGISLGIALSATLLYRILNKALFLPIGFYYYSQIIGQKDADIVPIADEGK